ncbi:cobyric acid synthase [Dethiobacter alkaliphilus]|uniref:Cobyric acid synthase n=1 Tax=Dethiobacter alkaliphilus AHT 1 TaxID=555088 RepID=C0GDX4_DETAL|nr:cobyric acid synthase [Dethiobacter alkaliphilus]EEG78268.1 cobyric acid synthase CobQ [Dethiobacter alkaliphilus AHT 1]
MTAVLMVQGTSSDAGKSILCAALCRYFAQEGFSVAPFKAQNMALNAMAVDGGEIGWAQVMQAEAAGAEPEVAMNPVLLKPVSDTHSQVVVNGISTGNMSAAHYQEHKKVLFPEVLSALNTLRRKFDVVVMEGAGSPAEVNLREHDIVNMRLAEAADAPVLLISDIDRGGMFAYVAGTLALLNESERARVDGVIVNRFRGIKERLQPGLDMLTERIHKPVIGVIPYLDRLSLPAEDSLALGGIQPPGGELDVAVIQLPRIANFTDYHVLATENGVRLRYVQTPQQLGSPHLVILPGSKNTLADLRWLKSCGLAKAVAAAVNGGSSLVGICGGYQMLGRRVVDLQSADGTGGSEEGLGLLPVETEFLPQKTTVRVKGETIEHGEELCGYEIHMGQTTRGETEPFARLTSEKGQSYEDGAVSADKRVFGTYLHGLFDAATFRHGFLNRLRKAHGLKPQEGDTLSARQKREQSYQLLAQAVREHLDCDLLKELVQRQF